MIEDHKCKSDSTTLFHPDFPVKFKHTFKNSSGDQKDETRTLYSDGKGNFTQNGFRWTDGKLGKLKPILVAKEKELTRATP